MKTAVVTGSTGFIGRRLCEKLTALGWRVFELTRETYDLTSDKSGEKLRALFESEKPTVVFHLASKFLAQHESKDLSSLIESNVLFGTRLLQTIAEMSASESGSSSKINFITAGSGWQRLSKDDSSPVNLYAATKSAFSAITTYFTASHELRAAELRLFDTYGPADTRKKVVDLLIQTAQNPPTSPVSFSPGQQKLYLVHVEDAVMAFIQAEEWLAKQPLRTHAFFRVDADSLISLKDLAREVEMLTKVKLSIQWGGRPYRPREVMMPFSEWKRVPGWAPGISLRQGLREVLETYQNPK